MKKIFKYSFIVLAALVASTTAINAQTYNPDPQLIAGQMPEGIVFNKTAEKISANDYLVNIETYVTGTTTQTETQYSQPFDVVMLLDVSSSMTETMNNGKTRIECLKGAVNGFIDLVAADSNLPENEHHKVSVIQFGSKVLYNPEKDGNNNLFRTRTVIGLSDVTSDNVQSNFKDKVSDIYIGSDVGTWIDYSLGLVTTEMTEAAKDTGRPIYLIIFTDGIPGSGFWTTGSNGDVANTVISKCAEFKQNQQVKVYTIGIFDKKDSNISKVNQYLGLASSNYSSNITAGFEKGTTTIVEPSEDPVADGYYKITTDSNELSEIFSSIANKAIDGSAKYDLSSESTANVDIVSDLFLLPKGMKESEVSLSIAKTERVDGDGNFVFGDPISTFPCQITVKDENGEFIDDYIQKPAVSINEDEQRVVVTGFDYSKYYVSAITDAVTSEIVGYTGCKLIISFHLNINPTNPGGANEMTNTKASGLYLKDSESTNVWNQISAFNQPKVQNPNILIVKRGLHNNESAVFTVHDENGKMADMTVVATCDENDSDAYAYIKVQNEGRYKVSEEPSWTWAYGNKSVSVTKDNSTDKLDTTGHLYIIRDVNASTEDSTTFPGKKGTVFIFENVENSGNPAHGEGYKNNVFSGHSEPTSTTK